jgi:peptidyl-prolyl cis-trans isomerase D
MFEFVRTHNRLLFLVMVLLIFPSFVFFGVQDYRGAAEGGGATVARVDGRKVTRAEWDAYHRQQADRLGRAGLDARLIDSPQMRKQSLDALIRERALYAAAQEQRLTVTDDMLRREIFRIPDLAVLKGADGSVDIGAYKAFLQQRGYSPEAFEASLRQDVLLQQVVNGAAAQVPEAAAPARVAAESLLQRRKIQLQVFEAKDYSAKLEPTAEQLADYFKRHEAAYRTDEQAAIEYVTLDVEALKKSVVVTEDQTRGYYKENESRYTSAEERQASHILFTAEKSAPADQRKAAKAQAESILAQVRKSPEQFAALAKKHSQDPGSAAQGGDLGFQGRKAWVPSFENAVFAMKPGEISNLVETDFGYHIIRLQAVRGGERKSFEAVRAEVENDYRTQQAQKAYADSTDAFGNTAYEQSDSLQPLADKFKLEKKSAVVGRTPALGAAAPLDSPKLLEAVFGDDVLKNKRNSQPVETARSSLTVARLVEHRPSRARPFDEVKAQVREAYVQEQALEQVRKEGEARVAQLKSGGDTAGLGALREVSRTKPDDTPFEVVRAALEAPLPLPQVLGVSLGSRGFAAVRVVESLAPATDAPEFANLAPQYTRAWANAQSAAYVEALRKRMGTEILIDPAASQPAVAR